MRIADRQTYSFTDEDAVFNSNEYRLRIEYNNGRKEYTNVVRMKTDPVMINVYPNPVRNVVYISLQSEKAGNYEVEMLGGNGQTVYRTDLQNVSKKLITINRRTGMKPGTYLIRIRNTSTGFSQTQKVILE
jgi:hypothetical protein